MKNILRLLFNPLASLTLWIFVWAFLSTFLQIINPPQTTDGGLNSIYPIATVVTFFIFLIFAFIVHKIKLNNNGEKQLGIEAFFSYINLFICGLFIINIIVALIVRIQGEVHSSLAFFISANEFPLFPEEWFIFIISSFGFTVIFGILIKYLTELRKGNNLIFRK